VKKLNRPAKPHPRLLMCRPDHYGIEYEINPWMDRKRAADRERAKTQWEGLTSILSSLGASIELIEPIAGLPDLVFTANAGVVCHDLFITSHFRHPQRQGESEHFDRWFAERGYRVCSLANGRDFEGAGDALFCGDILFAGYLHRSEIRAHQTLGRLLECQSLGMELVDPRFYHLDTCFCPLAPGLAIYFPAAFDDYGRRVLAEHVSELVPVEEADAERFGCNAVVVGGNVVLNAGCDALYRRLESLGFSVHPTDLSEFLKAGGSAKCLTLRLDGEEAAVWNSTAA
jgi:N-dimethylarginine dimethylaminohydrolase